MRFIRSRFGIVLWCAIALMIAIVPLWRLRAARQWNFASVRAALIPDYNSSPILFGSQEPEPTPLPIPYGLTKADEKAAAGRFPGEPGAQLAKLDYGALNWRVQKLIRGSYEIPRDAQSGAPIAPAPGSFQDAQSLASMKARAEEVKPRLWKLTDPYFAQYDALERRFPESVLVRAQHLREVSSYANFSDHSNDEAIQDSRTQLIEYGPSVSNQTLEDAIRSAREGARLQPDNAFFPWMEAVFQFTLERPNDALRALEAAGKCSTFDDFTYRTLEERTRLMKRLRATGWEDDLSEQASALFPHYSRMRAATRAASWQMQQARLGKDKAADYRWAAALSRASYPIVRNERNSIISNLVGQAICKISWAAAAEGQPDAPAKPAQDVVPPQREQDFERFNAANAAIFARIARENGDDALARQTLAVAASMDAGDLVRYGQTDPGGLDALNFRLSIFYWLGAQLLRISLGGALIWLAFLPVTRRSPIVAGTRAKMLLPAMFCAGVSGAILVGAALFAPSLYGLLFGSYPNPSEDETSWMVAVVRDRWALILALLWGVLIVGGAIGSAARARDEGERNSLRPWRDIIFWAVAAICGSPVFLFYPDFRPADFANDFVVYGATLILLPLSAAASFASIRRAAGLKRVLTICLVGIFWTGWIAPISASFLFPGGLDILFFWLAVAPLVLGALLSAVVLLGRGMKRAHLGEIAAQIAARARIAAGVLALLGAIAYLGIALWTIPVEAKTRAMMGRQLQIGGVAWLREQMTAKN